MFYQSEGRNGILQYLGAWSVRGLVLGAGLFAHAGAWSWSTVLDRFGMYSEACCTRIKRLEASRTVFQMSFFIGMGVGAPGPKGSWSFIGQNSTEKLCRD